VQRAFSPEALSQLVRRFEDIGYVASASPDMVVEFLRHPGSRRPPLLNIAQHLLAYFILPRQLFSMAPETASELLSIARKGPFSQICKRLCTELEDSNWLPREENSFFREVVAWETRHRENPGVAVLARRSVRLRNELLETALTYGSRILQENVLLESLARPLPGDVSTGVAVLKLARELGRGETLMSSIQEMKNRPPAPGQGRSQGAAQTFMQMFRLDLEAAPISAIEDLRWFAQLCRDERLSTRIEELAARTARSIDQPALFSADDE
jgi:hypothetical protein